MKYRYDRAIAQSTADAEARGETYGKSRTARTAALATSQCKVAASTAYNKIDALAAAQAVANVNAISEEDKYEYAAANNKVHLHLATEEDEDCHDSREENHKLNRIRVIRSIIYNRRRRTVREAAIAS